MATDCYETLGVPRTASSDEIKKQYKKLAVKFHPDKNQAPEAHDRFLRINEAYETLKDAALRRAYDEKNGISMRPAQQPQNFSGFPDPFNVNFAGFSRQSTRKYRSGTSYFESYFTTGSDGFGDPFARARRQTAEERERKMAETAAHAKMALDEHNKRVREEYMRRAQQQREQEELERRRLEKEEEARRMEDMLRQHMQQNQTDPVKRERFSAQSNLWDLDTDEPPRSKDGLGRNSAEPIVVEDDTEVEEVSRQEPQAFELNGDGVEEEDASEDEEPIYADANENSFSTHYRDEFSGQSETSEEEEEEGEEGEEQQKNTFFGHDRASNPPSEGILGDEDISFASEGHELPKTPVSEPDIVEIDGPDDTVPDILDPTPSQERIKSPRRAPSMQQRPDEFRKGAKKARLSNFDEMKSSLGVDIGDVDFSDIRATLPGGVKVRKLSSSNKTHSAKRAKIAEFVDGLTRALTLFTPVNKLNQRSSSQTLSAKDLQPNVDPASLKFSHEPPRIHLPSSTKREWDIYVARMHVYQQQFAVYRKNILEYQVARYEIDERSQNTIYSDADCLSAYQACLAEEQEIVQGYNAAFQEFQQALRVFRANCAIMM